MPIGPLFTAFLATLGDFETAYGPLAGIAALMTWVLVASVTILLTAHLVAVLNRVRYARRRHPGSERRRAHTGRG
jgi:uncharacterized BrkB/YihY/UPF0761 family membrane protein